MAYPVKKGDLWPPVTGVASDRNGPINLAGATVRFRLKQRDGRKKVDGVGSIDGDPALGRVRYDWRAGDTDTPGHYHAEFKITLASGQPVTIPNEDYEDLVIWDTAT